MKTLLVLAGILSAGVAHARPSTLDMNCSEAQALVAQEGAIVLTTGAYTFDRFVAHQGYCMQSEVTKPAWVPTFDEAQCFIGYTCGDRSGGN